MKRYIDHINVLVDFHLIMEYFSHGELSVIHLTYSEEIHTSIDCDLFI